MQNQRKTLYEAFESTEQNWKVNGGVNLLNQSNYEACNNFLNQLDEYGVFVIRNGELESWLKNIGATGHGSSWLIDIFTKMGENPDDGNYLKPAEGDVWDFIGKVKNWIENSTRKGIPQ